MKRVARISLPVLFCLLAVAGHSAQAATLEEQEQFARSLGLDPQQPEQRLSRPYDLLARALVVGAMDTTQAPAVDFLPPSIRQVLAEHPELWLTQFLQRALEAGYFKEADDVSNDQLAISQERVRRLLATFDLLKGGSSETIQYHLVIAMGRDLGNQPPEVREALAQYAQAAGILDPLIEKVRSLLVNTIEGSDESNIVERRAKGILLILCELEKQRGTAPWEFILGQLDKLDVFDSAGPDRRELAKRFARTGGELERLWTSLLVWHPDVVLPVDKVFSAIDLVVQHRDALFHTGNPFVEWKIGAIGENLAFILANRTGPIDVHMLEKILSGTFGITPDPNGYVAEGIRQQIIAQTPEDNRAALRERLALLAQDTARRRWEQQRRWETVYIAGQSQDHWRDYSTQLNLVFPSERVLSGSLFPAWEKEAITNFLTVARKTNPVQANMAGRRLLWLILKLSNDLNISFGPAQGGPDFYALIDFCSTLILSPQDNAIAAKNMGWGKEELEVAISAERAAAHALVVLFVRGPTGIVEKVTEPLKKLAANGRLTAENRLAVAMQRETPNSFPGRNPAVVAKNAAEILRVADKNRPLWETVKSIVKSPGWSLGEILRNHPRNAGNLAAQSFSQMVLQDLGQSEIRGQLVTWVHETLAGLPAGQRAVFLQRLSAEMGKIGKSDPANPALNMAVANFAAFAEMARRGQQDFKDGIPLEIQQRLLANESIKALTRKTGL